MVGHEANNHIIVLFSLKLPLDLHSYHNHALELL